MSAITHSGLLAWRSSPGGSLSVVNHPTLSDTAQRGPAKLRGPRLAGVADLTADIISLSKYVYERTRDRLAGLTDAEYF